LASLLLFDGVELLYLIAAYLSPPIVTSESALSEQALVRWFQHPVTYAIQNQQAGDSRNKKCVDEWIGAFHESVHGRIDDPVCCPDNLYGPFSAVRVSQLVQSGTNPDVGPAVQIPVLIEPVAGNGYRARGAELFSLSAEGATREEALAKLREQLEARMKAGGSVTLE